MIDLDEPRFTMKEVAKAIGGDARLNTIQSWFQRGHFKMNNTDVKAEPGLGHRISMRTALQVSIAFQLYEEAGLHPAKGAEIAKVFTHFGDDERDPGEVYSKDFTVLVAFPKIGTGRVVNMTSATSLFDAFLAPGYGRQRASTIISLNHVEKDLHVALLQGGKGTGSMN